MDFFQELQSSENPLPDPPEVTVGPDTIAGIVRTVRRRVDMSQRQLAAHIKVSSSTISRVEAGSLTPSLEVFLRILAAAELMLVVTDSDGKVVRPMRIWDDVRDGGEKRFPAHLDLILDPDPGDWWADEFGLARPPETYHRSRQRRDAERKLSQWSVRVAQYRNDPQPPDPRRMRFPDEE